MLSLLVTIFPASVTVYVVVSAVLGQASPQACAPIWHPEIVIPALATSATAATVGFWNRPERRSARRSHRR